MKVLLIDRLGFEKFMEVPDDREGQVIRVPVIPGLRDQDFTKEKPDAIPIHDKEFFPDGFIRVYREM